MPVDAETRGCRGLWGSVVSCRGVHGVEGQVQWDGLERQPLRRLCLEGRAVKWKVLEEGVPQWPGCGVAAPGGRERLTEMDICHSQGRRSEFWDLWGITRVPLGVGESGLRTVVMHPSPDWG